jgi:hypothetical protein
LREFYPSYHAAVSLGLSGDPRQAEKYFQAVASADDDRDWAVAVKADAVQLARLVNDTSAFRLEIASRVSQTRRALKLDADFPVEFM